MVPFVVRFQYVAMINLGDTLLDAAQANGAGWFRRTLLIHIPLLRQSLISGAIFVMILLMQEFTAALLVRTRRTEVLGTLLYDQWSGGSYPLVAAIALLMIALTAVGVGLVAAVGGRRTFESGAGGAHV
jgi:iron(III) transport system permease protein